MALSRKKYRRLPELYVTGTTVLLKDGNPVWLQVLNPLERDEAAHDSQVARARMVMAIKEGTEREKIVAQIATDGREASILKLADYRTQIGIAKIVDELAVDPDWAERVEIMNRSDDLQSREADDDERALLTKINEEYLNEILRRQKDEHDFQTSRLQALPDQELFEDYSEAWIERRGADVARLEYQLTEIWYGARVCEGVRSEDGEWTHDGCESHSLRLYEHKSDVRELPEQLQDLFADTLGTLNMSVRDARFSARQGSSSDSSPLPSEAAESTPSTPTATPAGAPGT